MWLTWAGERVVWGGGAQRQDDGEDAAAADFTDQLDTAAHGVDKLVNDGQSKPDPAELAGWAFGDVSTDRGRDRAVAAIRSGSWRLVPTAPARTT